MNKHFWQGTNFWVSLVLLIGGFFVGFDADAATGVVSSVFAVVGAVFGIREKIKGTVPFKEWLGGSNTWNYIGAIVVSIIPAVPLELFSAIHEVLRNAIGGNWQGLAIAAFSLITILWNIFRGNRAQVAAGAFLIVLLYQPCNIQLSYHQPAQYGYNTSANRQNESPHRNTAINSHTQRYRWSIGNLAAGGMLLGRSRLCEYRE